MSNNVVLFAGGLFHFAFFVFHLFFWKLLDWKNDLASLTHTNRAVIQIFNLCLMFVFLMFAYISFFHTSELLSSSLGRSLLVLIAALWGFRAILQIVFFGLRNRASIVLFLASLVGNVLYLIPVLTR